MICSKDWLIDLLIVFWLNSMLQFSNRNDLLHNHQDWKKVLWFKIKLIISFSLLYIYILFNNVDKQNFHISLVFLSPISFFSQEPDPTIFFLSLVQIWKMKYFRRNRFNQNKITIFTENQIKELPWNIIIDDKKQNQ